MIYLNIHNLQQPSCKRKFDQRINRHPVYVVIIVVVVIIKEQGTKIVPNVT